MATKLVSLGCKVTAEVKNRIDRMAEESGRTQSEVAEALMLKAWHYDEIIRRMLEEI
jgi:predicted transcriptional regulator